MRSSLATVFSGLLLMGSLTACSILPDSSDPALGAARAAAMGEEGANAGTRLSVSGVLFESEQASLKAGANEIVSQAVSYLNDNPGSRVVVEGHTDHLGPARYNQQLSEKRAGAIVKALKANGISADRITAVGYGESQPIADNSTADGRRANRRVELILQNDLSR